MITCEHVMPGRIRLKARGSSPEFLNHLRQSLLALPGIRSVEARVTTGSLVVHHEGSVSKEAVLDRAGVTGTQQASALSDSLGSQVGVAVADLLVQSALEHVLGKPAMLVLNALL